ncbi:MAG: YihY/virulence factor BrkB family protein [Gemmataceae bacterium]|nr:YihY/virulence factor BrkB family protein [Gemmataceae bacterium]
MNWRAAYELVRDAAMNWWNDKAPRLGASLAFYTVLSLSPLVIVVLGICGLVFGPEAVQGQLVTQIRGMVGEEGAKAIQEVLASASSPRAGILATIIGLVTLFFGATSVFIELQDSLNTVWDVQAGSTSGFFGFIWDRLLSFAMVCGLAFLLLVSLLMDSFLGVVNGMVSDWMPEWSVILGVLNQIVTFGVVTILFACVYKLLPAVRLAWRDVWMGALMTAGLFTVGKILIGLYLGNSAVGSAYGAAGSFIVLLVWIYYSTQILFFGAELTQVYATRYGSGFKPVKGAKPTDGRKEKDAQRNAPSAQLRGASTA